MESPPPDTWTESGLTPVLTESSSSRLPGAGRYWALGICGASIQWTT